MNSRPNLNTKAWDLRGRTKCYGHVGGRCVSWNRERAEGARDGLVLRYKNTGDILLLDLDLAVEHKVDCGGGHATTVGRLLCRVGKDRVTLFFHGACEATQFCVHPKTTTGIE